MFESSFVENLAHSLSSLKESISYDTIPCIVVGSAVVGAGYYAVFTGTGLPLPPGPTVSWFGLGGKRTTKMPHEYSWLVFSEWQKRFGDVIYVNVFRNPVLVLNSAEAAMDLLDRKSAIYSSRPVRTMQTEVMGFSWLFSSLPYGARYRKHRTMFHNHFQAKVIPKYHQILLNSVHTLLRNLADEPEELKHNLRRTTTAIVLSVTYGQNVADQGDEYVKLADETLAGVVLSGQFGSYLVDYLPILKYIPSWFPGAKFKRDGLKYCKLSKEMCNRPFEMMKARMESGSAETSLTTIELETLFRERDTDLDDERVIQNVAATAYAAGSDTTLSILLSFFLAMVLHPEIQDRAYAEIQKVIPDGDRLPAFEERDKLPYIERVVHECLRWNPVGNLGIAHYLTEDDVYRGWRIPKGTTVLANIWAILHEPSVYPDPSSFNPDRFSNAQQVGGLNPIPEMSFGFGRRVCPGRYLAVETVWIVAVSVIASYKILKPLDETGKEFDPEVAYTSGLFSYPRPFGYRIVSRSKTAAALVAATRPEL
ncbi:O-methylsterigmatocystin oxidoreductase [Favolaschia claudopus]|uniref:O-methylsterigmatocystin oxidoreductase n=1 Tax=Favolaschia claudopus TaxID=2862362 RepID=A0AAW0AMT4_9AGAR